MKTSLLVLALLMSAGAPTGDARELDAALEALSEGDFESALAHVEAGLRQARDDASLAKLHLVQGEIHAALRRYEKMETAFSQALEADPDARLDPERVQPTVVKRFESLRERLRGELVIDTEPPGAELRLDGQLLGQAPWRGQVPIGTHSLEVGPGTGSSNTRVQVKVRPGRTEQVHVVVSASQEEAAEEGSDVSALTLGVQGRVALGLAPLSGVGMEAGAWLGGRYLHAELDATVGSRFGLAARLGAHAPELVGPVTLFVSLDGYALPSPAVLGAGLTAGASLPVSTRIEFFAELSGRWLSSNDSYDSTHLLGTTGLRLRLNGP
ncbi:PEGA domain-containing protein [Hyalangium versicolor]|uniref:PEGA domain-containing protein n=1 Tax=Hyalangium versicolor TaxID=2861190 RepID=UPI001CCE53B7|nr:PEGA domain-containing protein [Hyalangium versicolor]